VSKGLNTFTQTDVCKHQINLKETKPVKQPVRRVPYTMRDEVKKQLDNMLDAGLIKESESPWASPIVLVRKANGSLRICVDYRRLNEVTIKDCYPLPKIEDMLVILHKAKFYTILDLASGYHQIGIKTVDKPKIAFVTEFGLFEYNVMPFGLTNAPPHFSV